MTSVPVEVSNFFLAMQVGCAGGEALAALFDEIAVYEEPFSGTVRRHEGRAAIMAAMALGWEIPMVDTRIEIRHAETTGGEVHVAWTCHSPSLPGGKGSGLNRFTFRDGRIISLITTLEEE
ncbi:hypothetical protein DEA8626_00195 [Defluviimonas aquaemixtae]|uniref:SnoaL-like domain-containing protein n=1 Tax=Albidovulum aquaemixtae TaxID=1542388 RepID=A0A2R8B232_9RHOB|nr:nuclear transport factor 2 family protein [Defluviimonas aquaemixtae]SPH16684.1 hypothetical protein DEA8626_00195 [Defluviimonas aquaemixtae]